MPKCILCKKNPVAIERICIKCSEKVSNNFSGILRQTKEMIESIYNIQFPADGNAPSLDCQCIGRRNIIAIDYFTLPPNNQLIICGICRRCQGYTEVATEMKFDYFVKDSILRGMETDNTEPFNGDYYS